MTSKKFDEFWIRIFHFYKDIVQECKNQKVVIWIRGGVFEEINSFEKILAEYKITSQLADEQNATVVKYKHMFSTEEVSVKGFFDKAFVYASIFIFGKKLKSIDLCKTNPFDGNEFLVLHSIDEEGELRSEVNFVAEVVIKKVREYLLQAV